jgi:PST family polysaccharide transporter
MTIASPLDVITPRLTLGTLRSMLGFGLGFQAVGLSALARNQGVNLVVAAAGGTQLLGYWSLANRLMQVPFWLFQALWRVSYPTMARLRALGEDTRLTVERFARVTALACGATLAPLAASAHYLVPALFGTDWSSAADPLPWASAGLVVAGPISVASACYLYSEGDVRTPWRRSSTERSGSPSRRSSSGPWELRASGSHGCWLPGPRP